MSHEKTTEDLNTSVDEVTNLFNDTFVCCMRNYEAILPYLEKKETKFTIYHKLLQINGLLKKLNDELAELKVEYVTVSSHEQKRKTNLSEEGRKRKTSDVLELGRPETGINSLSGNLVSTDTEDTQHTQIQNADIHIVKHIKRKKTDSYETAELVEFTTDKCGIHATETSCNTMKNTATVHLLGSEESASVADRVVGANASDTSADTVIQRESNKDCVPLQNIKAVLSSLALRSENDNVNIKSSVAPSGAEGHLNGIILTDNGVFVCTTCKLRFFDLNSLRKHVKGKKHKRKRRQLRNGALKKSCAKKPNMSDNCGSTVSVSACATTTCSLADTVAIVENSCQSVSAKDAVKLDDMWKYFPALVHINKKYFRIIAGQVRCFLCNEHIGGHILQIKIHISKFSHLHRINVLMNIEVENMSSNNQLLNIPGIQEKIIPRTQFSWKKNSFFCTLCQCSCPTEVVLNHMTGTIHCLNLGGMRQINVDVITITRNQCKSIDNKCKKVKKVKKLKKFKQ